MWRPSKSPIPEAGPRCPDCGRPVHAVPTSGGVRLLAPIAIGAAGWTFGPHVCLPRGARYPVYAIREGPPREFDRII